MLGELRGGRKRSHWMWYVFPQLVGLGSSAMASRYGIASLDEARAYLAHPVLGPRLVECTEALLQLQEGRTAAQVMGYPDDMKLRSCATLFAQVSPARVGVRARVGPVFRRQERRADARPAATMRAGRLMVMTERFPADSLDMYRAAGARLRLTSIAQGLARMPMQADHGDLGRVNAPREYSSAQARLHGSRGDLGPGNRYA